MVLRIILSCFLAGFVSQGIKILIALIKHKRIILLADGDFPSTHSAFMTALTFSIYLLEGVSTGFIIALGVTLIILKDTIGLRRNVGQILKALNKNKILKIDLSEGHTVIQMISGIAIGIIVTILSFLLYRIYWL